MARRPSLMHADLLGGPSPIPGDDRRKSLFPILANHRKSSVGVGGIASLLAAKKFRKQALKVEKREGSPAPIQVNYEPTYRMEPRARLTMGVVHKVLKELVSDRLNGFQYNPKFCVTMTQVTHRL